MKKSEKNKVEVTTSKDPQQTIADFFEKYLKEQREAELEAILLQLKDTLKGSEVIIENYCSVI